MTSLKYLCILQVAYYIQQMLDITNNKANVLVKEQTSLIFVSSVEFLYDIAL